MRIGEFNRQITIEKRVVPAEQDSVFGTEQLDWEPLSALAGSPVVAERFAAEVLDMPSTRSEGAVRSDLVLGKRVARIRIRWRPDVDGTMRVTVHGDEDRVMQIVGGPFEYGGRKVGLEFYCEDATS